MAGVEEFKPRLTDAVKEALLASDLMNPIYRVMATNVLKEVTVRGDVNEYILDQLTVVGDRLASLARTATQGPQRQSAAVPIHHAKLRGDSVQIDRLLVELRNGVYGAYTTQYQRYASDVAAINLQADDIFDVTGFIDTARTRGLEVEVHFVRGKS
jgi:hypothetical protein